ncbi:toll/interleukin-1 receptor domain-containing protein [Streptomyces zingiberis]|uniref:Toll/interleukin-1 receptor domain-containing protein n=1 Tax=Streptomyces zingiberis TaxID=2053010 RepID=A0ABX1C1U1_9ACTN|nr:TIR domain-containing protein [Streptomyces zingiberis]NJQ00859.1 toll/interleukin-1 receptor domain-containing protein [Streptomyces zingiberis]
MSEVFVNYRTGDGDQAATLIARELNNRFGDGTAFRASDSIKPGRTFPVELLQGVRRSSVLLSVIGPAWTKSGGLGRSNDWVSKEIVEALDCHIPLLPVLLGRATARLDPASLPAGLAQLAEIQSLRLDMQTSEADLARIGDTLADLVPALGARDRAAAEERETGEVRNSISEVRGTAVQSRDFTGDVGHNVVKDSRGPVHTGSGNLYQNSPHYQDAQHYQGSAHYEGSAHYQNSRHHQDSHHFTGEGTTYVAGDNHQGIRHQQTTGRPAEREGEDGDR